MKHPILTTIVGAAAIVAFPSGGWAQEVAPETPSSSSATPPSSQTGGTESLESGGTFSQQHSKEGAVSSGVMVHDGVAYVIHRLQSEMSLPDGSKIQPNGVIQGKDGTLRQVGEDQMLSLDGRVMTSPFVESGKGATPPSTTQPEAAPSPEPEPTSPSTQETPSTPSVSPQTSPSTPTPPSSSTPFTPGSSPNVQPPEPSRPLDTPSPEPGLKETAPLSTEPRTAPSAESPNAQPTPENNPTQSQPPAISTDPSRDSLD